MEPSGRGCLAGGSGLIEVSLEGHILVLLPAADSLNSGELPPALMNAN